MDELSRKLMAWQSERKHGSRSLRLTPEERRQLDSWAQEPARGLAQRARIVLSCNGGDSDRAIASRLGLTPRTIAKWRARFAMQRLAGLLDAPRSGAPRSISDAAVEAVLALSLRERAAGGPRSSSRRLAAAVGVSQTTVLRIWRAFGLSGR